MRWSELLHFRKTHTEQEKKFLMVKIFLYSHLLSRKTTKPEKNLAIAINTTKTAGTSRITTIILSSLGNTIILMVLLVMLSLFGLMLKIISIHSFM